MTHSPRHHYYAVLPRGFSNEYDLYAVPEADSADFAAYLDARYGGVGPAIARRVSRNRALDLSVARSTNRHAGWAVDSQAAAMCEPGTLASSRREVAELLAEWRSATDA